MPASLAIGGGTLFVGGEAKTAWIRSFDLAGRETGPSLSFRDGLLGRSAVGGLAMDGDHSLLVADTPCDRVRRFSLFGREVGGLGTPAEHGAVRGVPLLPGLVRRPVDVEAFGNQDDGWVAIACAGEGRHAVQIFAPDFAYRSSCASLGDSQGVFRNVVRLAASGDRLAVAESGARRIQVFRAGQFLFAFGLAHPRAGAFEPSAVALLPDRRFVVACREPESALFLLDPSGRPLRRLAVEGLDEGAVSGPSDLAVDLGRADSGEGLYVVDRDGLRVQLFTLEGRVLGSISLEGSSSTGRQRGGKRGGR